MGLEFFLELIAQLLGWVFELWFVQDASRSIFGDSEWDRQARRVQWKFLLAAMGLVILVVAAVSFYRRYFSA